MLSLDNIGIDSGSLAVMALLAGFFLIALWSAVTRMHPEELLPAFGPRARGVFLSVRFGDRQPTTGHVTRIGMRVATIVSPKFFGKGDELDFDFDSLPDFPHPGGKVKVRVVSASNMGGHPATYLIKVRFPELETDSRQSLRQFIDTLTSPGIVSHA